METWKQENIEVWNHGKMIRMEEDPDGTSQQVAVIMTGKVYREAGLKYSKHPEVEGLLYDKLCRIGKHKLRDDVRKLALGIALSVADKEFKPTVAWLDDFMRRFCLSKKKMGFHSSAMLKQKGFKQAEAKAATTMPNITQEDVFSVLGYSVDCNSSNPDKCSTSEIDKNEDLQIPATSGQNSDKSENSECANLLTDCSENTSLVKTAVEKNVNGTSSTGTYEDEDADANKNTSDSVVDDVPANLDVSEVDDACSEKSSMVENINELPDISQVNLSAPVTHKSGDEDDIEEVLLDDASEDNKEEQNFPVKQEPESKIGKISIKKIEDLCEKGTEEKKEDSASQEKNSEVDVSSESSKEDESEDDDARSDEEMSEGSDSSSKNVIVSKQGTSKYEQEENISYSNAENKFYKKNIDAMQKKLEGSVIKCTSCYEQVNHHIRSLVFTHPVLGVFICKKCRKYYGRGKFCKDGEGYDEYCRLCAEGGDLLCCEQEDCYNGFCKRCVKRTLGRAELKHAETTEGWACYVCDPTPFMELRALHRLILNNLKNSEEEDAALSRKDLKSKTLENKFKSLKQVRQLRAQKEGPKNTNKFGKGDGKTSKTDSHTSKKEEETKENKKKSYVIGTQKEEVKNKTSKATNNGSHENEDEDNKPCPILRTTLDEMLEMMSKCMENIKIVESKWKKSKYSSVGTERAKHHVLKQLDAIKTNFDVLGTNLAEASAREDVQMKDKLKEHNESEQIDKQVRTKCLDNKNQDISCELQSNSENKIKQDENHILKSFDLLSKSGICDKEEKSSGDNKNKGQSQASEEATPSSELADPVDPYEDGSQHSSKACLAADDEHSLPDLMDVIQDLISDPDEPMDSETKSSTAMKSLDVENDIPKLSEDLNQEKVTEEDNVGNVVAAECTDGMEENCKETEASKRQSLRKRTTRSATVESRSGSEAGVDETISLRTSQQCRRLRSNRHNNNEDASDKEDLGKNGKCKDKNEEMVDGDEDMDSSEVNKAHETEKSCLKSSPRYEQEELVGGNLGKNLEESDLNPLDESRSKSTSDEDSTGDDIYPNKSEKKQVQNDDPRDDRKSEEVESDKHEIKETKTRKKRKVRNTENNASDLELNEGSESAKEAGTTKECEEPSKLKKDSDAMAKRKKTGSIQNNGFSKKGKIDKKKEEFSKDKKARKPRKLRGKQRRLSENEDDKALGLVEGSESSEEENTDEEIQRRREDHTEKRRDAKKKIEKKRSFESEDKKEKKGHISEVKAVKDENGEGKDESENEKENKECKDIGNLEDKNNVKTEESESFSCKVDGAAKTKSERDKKVEKSDSIKKEECNVKLEQDEEFNYCDEEVPTKEDQKKASKNKKAHSIKTENQLAKAAILESDSDVDLDDKPMPMSKKKSIRRQSGSLNKCKSHKKLMVKLTEEEYEELKAKQLKGKCQVLVESLSSEVQEKLKGDEFIYASDYPELGHLFAKKQGFDGDGCEGDEEDSDKEFSKLMKFKCGKIKPGPKSKVLKWKSMNDKTSEDDADISGHEENKLSGEESGNASNKEEMEKADKKLSQKNGKKKKEGLLDIDIDKDSEEENEDEEVDEVKKKVKNDGISLNEKMKKHILMSSEEEAEDDEEDQGDNPTNEQDEEEKERKKYDKKKERDAKKNEDEDNSDGEYAPKVHKKGYMNLNISTDEEKEEVDEEEEVPSAYEDDSDFEESPRKRRAFQISSSDSEGGNKKAKQDESTEEESEEEEEKPKSKRKRIRKMSSSSDDDGEVDKDSPSKHKKIRKVIKDEDLLETTKNATQEEEERRKRIAERQKNYNEIFMADVEANKKDLDKLVLDFDPETKSEIVSVHEKLVKQLKPHQFKGIKFMWDASIESLEQLKTKPGGGCILAHCMGLGKTLQVITFCHTLLTNKAVSKEIQRIMVCCPVNTIFNWVAEFKNWLKGKMLPFDVIELASAKDLWARAYRLDDWWKEGGICIIGYSMFRNLSNTKNKRFKSKMKEIFQKTLLEPGPDVVVCDEGHMLKNEKTALSIAINKVKTMRRIVLTGTPLQNNLKEYHCMIQFVKPNLLGTKKEFMNRFVNPIEQGQCVEAMPRDVRRMKRRAHILHNLLEGCVQRFDYTVLKPYLPPKFEYVISVQISEIQRKLYQYYLDNLARGGPKKQGSGLFVDFGALSRVWTHPKVLELAVRRSMYDDEEEELDDFICDDSTTSDSSDDERSKRKKKRAKKKDEESEEEEEDVVEETDKHDTIPGLTESGKVRVDWWKKVLLDVAGDDFEEDGYLDKIEHSGKIILLLEILKECCSIGDKVLLFSQSLLTLDMIEEFLQAIDQGEIELPEDEDSLPLPYKNWKQERDYLRLDGSTSADTRKHLCNIFNNPSNERCRLFLISTRAGGLGINLVGANRVIIFDSSWNPSHDTQSIFRVYRFGQKKPCYIYRFVAQGTMEEKIYSRQVTKMSTALRVVDEHQIKRYFKMDELAQLYEFNPSDSDVRETPIVPKDRLLAELLQKQKDWIVTYHEHESLLENQTSEELTEEERKAAWEDYENEKKGFMVQQNRNSVMPIMGAATMMNQPGLPSLSLSSFSFESVVSSIKAQNPNMSAMEITESVLLATKQIQKIHLNHYQRVQAMLYNLKNPMIAPEQRKLLPFGSHPEMLPLLEGQLRVLEDNIQRENQVIAHIDQGVAQQNQMLSTANLMAAGLIRGQPTSSGSNAATAKYVGRPSTSSVGEPSHQEKKAASNDVILLD